MPAGPALDLDQPASQPLACRDARRHHGDIAARAMPMPPRPLAFLLAVAASAPTPAAPSDHPLAWLAGDWCGRMGESRIEERWLLRGDQLLGVSATTRDGRLLDFEFLRIAPRDGGHAYLAQPRGRPPTEFALVERDGERAVFANPAHDFPRRIAYWRDDAGLHAEIAGPGEDGGERRLRFDFDQPCE